MARPPAPSRESVSTNVRVACPWRDSFRLPCRLEASSCCGRHVMARAAVLPTRVQQAEREHVAEEEVPGSPLDGLAELFRRGL